MFIYGKNAAIESLKVNKDIKKIFMLKKNKSHDNDNIKKIAKEKQIEIIEMTLIELNKKFGSNHQGVVVEIAEYKYIDLDRILEEINGQEHATLVILDGLEDPHNLGAIMRTADATGIDGIIIPKNRSVSLNQTVAKVSTGAIEYVKVSQVANLVQTIKKLKSEGFWVIGLDMKGSIDYRKQDYKGKIAVVIGSEGFGISRLVKENCDFFVNIPMIGHITSLNASVSASIIFYEILRNRFEN